MVDPQRSTSITAASRNWPKRARDIVTEAERQGIPLSSVTLDCRRGGSGCCGCAANGIAMPGKRCDSGWNR